MTDQPTSAPADLTELERRTIEDRVGRPLTDAEIRELARCVEHPDVTLVAQLRGPRGNSAERILRRAVSGAGVVDLGNGHAITLGNDLDRESEREAPGPAGDARLLATLYAAQRPAGRASSYNDRIAANSSNSERTTSLCGIEITRGDTDEVLAACPVGIASPDRFPDLAPGSEQVPEPTAALTKIARRCVEQAAPIVGSPPASDIASRLLRLLRQPGCTLYTIPGESGPSGESWIVDLPTPESALAVRICARRSIDPALAGRAAVVAVSRALAAAGAPTSALASILFHEGAGAMDVLHLIAMVDGITQVSRALGAPVVTTRRSSGAHATDGRLAIVAGIGVVARRHRIRPRFFRKAGESVVLLSAGRESAASGDEAEQSVQAAMRAILAAEFCTSTQVIDSGGLASALGQSCAGIEPVGARITLEPTLDADSLFLAESPARYLLSLGFECLDGVQGIAEDHGVDCLEIGEVGGDSLEVSVGQTMLLRLPLSDIVEACRESAASG